MAGAECSGDFAKLAKLIAGLDKLATPAFRASANRLLAEETISHVQGYFDTSTSPYGAPWKPPAHRKGKPLIDTGRLLGSLRVTSDATSFHVLSNVVYAAAMNFGTSTITRRQFMPDKQRGCPRRLRASYKEVLIELRREAVGR